MAAMAFDGAADEALSASDAIANVENITKHLSTVPDGIKIDLFNRSIELSSHYRDAVSAEASAVGAFKRDEKYSEKEQQMLCEAYSEVHNDLLDALDAQKDSLKKTPLGEALTNLLRRDKGAAKALDFVITYLLPTCKDSLSKELEARQKRLDQLFRAYDCA